MNNMELVEIKNLSKSYDDKEVLKIEAMTNGYAFN